MSLSRFMKCLRAAAALAIMTGLLVCGGCGAGEEESAVDGPYTKETKISDVAADPVFGDFGRLLFPLEDRYFSGDTLGQLELYWYNNIDPDMTVAIVNDLYNRAAAGETVFYDIYTEEEKAADPEKKDTGLFFFRGEPGGKFALCCAGGGFAYVGAMHDSFPHALELAKLGYNAFAVIYRPGAQSGCEDLARAVSFIFEHADELEVDTDCYSLWGGSAGGWMAGSVGTYGPAAFGGGEAPRPGTVVLQYTEYNKYSENEPPTFACVGTEDWISPWQMMGWRMDALQTLGVPTEFHVYEGLPHGFGLGTGTQAEGWLSDAVAFWEAQQ